MRFEQHPITDRASWLKLRERDITASVAGALIGVHDYQTAYGLWALKTGRVGEDVEETPAMQRGRLLEPVALQLLAETRPSWSVAPGLAYYRDPMDRLGATPDAFADDPERGRGIVQVKTVEASIFRRNWRHPDTGELELPLWIAVQAIVEAHLTGSAWACVAAMVVSHGLELEVIEVPVHPGVIERIRDAVHEFWGLVESGRSPDPDYARDGALIAQLYRDPDGAEIDLSNDNRLPEILVRRAELKAREADGNAAEKERRILDAEILAKLGPATRARLGDGTEIRADVVRRGSYTVQPTSFRPIRVVPPGGAPTRSRASSPAPAAFPERF